MLNEKLKTEAGSPYPLGATFDGKGVNFALFSSSAHKVMLCLFDEKDEEVQRIVMPAYTDEVFHVYVHDLKPGQRYGYRVFGEYNPEKGLRFNHNKLLLDPYAKALTKGIYYNETMLGYRKESGDLSFDRRNSAPFMPKCIVTSPFTFKSKKPSIPWNETVIYETHLKGFTKLLPSLDEKLRGTFEGMKAPDVVSYLKSLGITTVELLPIASFYTSGNLTSKGLSNYWGYDPVCFMAPHVPYLSQGRIEEVQTMVQVFHEAGIEVILDVVYNHTGEGNHAGPTLSFRGIDNGTYYRLHKDIPRYYEDTTGCGASLNVDHPRVLQLVMDSLRYWTEEMEVDGFRFDLATTVARDDYNAYSWRSSFLPAVRQDPVLQKVKLIAEPWDLGFDGYKVGSFPPGWSEWNDRYRDTVRRFWKSDKFQISDLAFRLTGSSDLFNKRGRKTWSSLNFITAHDGFTLRDLVSFNSKHNDANLEENRDGTDSNWGWNSGLEGDENLNEETKQIRLKRVKAMLATLFLSQGVPMLLSGDEVYKTQKGNNNAYCQDNDLSWFPWDKKNEKEFEELFSFVQRLIAFGRENSIFRQEEFLPGKYLGKTPLKDLTWITRQGYEMGQEDWKKETSTLGFMLNRGQKEKINEHKFVLLNASGEDKTFKMPENKELSWRVVFETFPLEENQEKIFKSLEEIKVPSWSLLVLSSEDEILDKYFFHQQKTVPERREKEDMLGQI
ncbi:MAG: glycogen debranching enzyme GlgX [Alphaproteobacteria bacterium]|nr:glycogen debranching enzyme GlgX [Alphaproteobacteria bacterium]